jgi:hypothetical protein
MGVSADTLTKRFPRLFHMAEAGSWPSIVEHGLLSALALTELFNVSQLESTAILERRRLESITLHDASAGRAVIRDQKPMDDTGLQRALRDGLTPREWYRLINEKAFFWLTESRLQRMRNARPYANERQTIMVVDTASFLEEHGSKVLLSPLNSGCTKPMPHPRGRDTFLSLAAYPYDAWMRKRRGRDPVVELAVPHSVPDVASFVVSVVEEGGGQPLVTLR